MGHLSEIMEHYRSARRARCCCTASTWATRGGPTARGAITRSSVCGAPTATGNTYYMSHKSGAAEAGEVARNQAPPHRLDWPINAMFILGIRKSKIKQNSYYLLLSFPFIEYFS